MKQFLIILFALNASLIDAGFFSRFFTQEPQIPEKYQVPADIKPILDSHADEMDQFFKENYCKIDIHKFAWLPNYWVKTTTSGRLEGLELVNTILAKYKQRMDLIEAPTKYLFIDKKNQRNRRPREYIIAAAVQGTVEPTGFLAAIQKKPHPTFLEKIKLHLGLTQKPPQLKINQTKQLADFIMKSGWWDSRRDNYAVTPAGKLCIIDTQIQTFTPDDK